MNEQRDFKGVWIPKEIWLSKELSMTEKCFLAEIDSFDNNLGCFASNTYFSDFFGLSPSRCSEIITALVKKKFVYLLMEKRLESDGFKTHRVIKISKPSENRIEPSENRIEPSEKAQYTNTVINPIINIEPNKKDKSFIAPTINEVTEYCIENGYSSELGSKVFNYYSSGNWKDSSGKKVKNWKQKCIAVWFKPENKVIKKTVTCENSLHWGKK